MGFNNDGKLPDDWRTHIPDWLRVSDKPRKGFPREEPAGLQGLTAVELEEVRAALQKPGCVKTELAQQYGVDEHVIRRIARGVL